MERDPSTALAVGTALLVLVASTALALPAAAAGGPTDTPPQVGTPRTAAAAAADVPTLERNVSVALTPDEPGRVAYEVSFEVPDAVTELRVRLPEGADVTATGGFEHDANTTYVWADSGDPHLAFEVAANRTGDRRALPARGEWTAQSGDAGYLFVDAGPWAVVEVPSLPTQWMRTGPELAFHSEVTVEGTGATGGEMAYLGAFEEYTRTAHGQRFRVVVPAAATLRADPGAVLDAMAAASDTLRVGERDDEVFVVAGPTAVDWGARGLAGDTDAWVVADEPLTDPTNAWLHEYVHTRQGYQTTGATQWTVEGAATYYAAYLSLNQGLVDFTDFRAELARGASRENADTVLARQSTWTAGSNYLKGSLVWGDLDRRTRLATDSSASAAEVLRALNEHEGTVQQQTLLAAVREVAGGALADRLRRLTETRATPEMWSASEHSAAFDAVPARMAYDRGSPAYRVTGPYGDRTAAEPPRLVAGETLAVAVRVANVGGQPGVLDATLAVDGDRVARHTGDLSAGANATFSLEHTFDEPGLYEVRVGPLASQVRVVDPATPAVSALSVTPASPAEPGNVTVQVTLANDAAVPANGSVPVSVDGQQVASVAATLQPGERVTRTVEVRLASPGDHTVAAGDVTRTVTVGARDSGGVDVGGQPGFGPAAALAGLLLALAAAVGRATRVRPGSRGGDPDAGDSP